MQINIVVFKEIKMLIEIGNAPGRVKYEIKTFVYKYFFLLRGVGKQRQ